MDAPVSVTVPVVLGAACAACAACAAFAAFAGFVQGLSGFRFSLTALSFWAWVGT